MHHDEKREREEHERVRDVKHRLSQPKEEVEAEHRDHASAVQKIVPNCGGYNICGRCDGDARLPDHQIVIVVAVEGHPVIDREHKGENSDGSHSSHAVSGSLSIFLRHSDSSLLRRVLSNFSPSISSMR